MSRPSNCQLKAVLQAIADYRQRYGSSPAVRDIVELLGFSSPSVVQNCLQKLQKEGYLQRRERKSRSLTLTGKAKQLIGALDEYQLPVLGRIRAGYPIPTLDGYSPGDETAFLRLTPDIVPFREHLYALEVEGDSMRDAMISSGDLVVLQGDVKPENGDIVAAWLRDRKETTLKRLYRPERKEEAVPAPTDTITYDDLSPAENATYQLELRPENRDYSSIWVAEKDLDVQGVVVAVIRRRR